MRYTPDRAGVVGIATSVEMRAALGEVLVKGQAFAETIAPVVTGDYKAHFQIDFDDRGSGSRKRARGTLANTSDHAAAVEFGPGTSKGHRVLGRTLAQLGKGRGQVGSDGVGAL